MRRLFRLLWKVFLRPRWLDSLDVGDEVLWKHATYPDWSTLRTVEKVRRGKHGTFWKISERKHWVGEGKMAWRGHPVDQA